MGLTFYSNAALRLIQAKRGMRGYIAIAKTANGESVVVKRCMARYSGLIRAAYRAHKALMEPTTGDQHDPTVPSTSTMPRPR